MSDFVISWQDQIQERDLISYVAEVNGGYAFIDENGNLNFETYTNYSASSIDINKCSSYKVGELHKIGRVYVELATATQYYPQTTSDDTLYLNPDNILFTDSQGYTIENTIKHIYDSIKDFTFYNISIEQCPIDPNVRAGQIISVGGWSHLLTSDGDYILTSDGNKIMVSEGLLVPFLCTIDWEYNTQWLGGYTTDLDCKVQEETQIVDTKKKLSRISIKVDRELGVISQSVAQLDDDLNEVEAKLELKVSKDDNDQIISMINASADNIILNTKSLIFGIYPNGQYIEVKNYYSNGTATGVEFKGTGTINITSQGRLNLENYNTDNVVQNALYFYNNNGNVAETQLINRRSSKTINSISLMSDSSIQNSLNITNYDAISTGKGNEIVAVSNDVNNFLDIYQYDGNGNLINAFEQSYSKNSGSNFINITAYEPTSTGYEGSNAVNIKGGSNGYVTILSNGRITLQAPNGIFANGKRIDT